MTRMETAVAIQMMRLGEIGRRRGKRTLLACFSAFYDEDDENGGQLNGIDDE